MDHFWIVTPNEDVHVCRPPLWFGAIGRVPCPTPCLRCVATRCGASGMVVPTATPPEAQRPVRMCRRVYEPVSMHMFPESNAVIPPGDGPTGFRTRYRDLLLGDVSTPGTQMAEYARACAAVYARDRERAARDE